MGRFNFLRNKVLITSIIVLLLISGTGMAAAYWKLAQNATPPNNDRTDSNDLPGYGSEEERDFGVRKNFDFQNLPPGSQVRNGVLYTTKGSVINLEMWFKGKIDKNPELAYADVMLLIDRSMSMKSKVGPSSIDGDCVFNGFDPSSDPNAENYIDPNNLGQYNNSKLCWTESGASDFVNRAGDDKARLKIGYVTYGSDDNTKREENSPYGWKGNAQFFKPLTDTWGGENENQGKRNEIRKWLTAIGFHTGWSGTAMAKGTDIALEELEKNGRNWVVVDGRRIEVKKYIVLLTDGIGNMQSDYKRNGDITGLTGCMSFRQSPSDAWPSNWPGDNYRRCVVPPGYPGNVFPNPTFDVPPYTAEWGDCCIESSLDIKEPFRSNGINRIVGVHQPFETSPIGLAIARGVRIPTIGFGVGINTNMNPYLLKKIADKTYRDGLPHYYLNATADGIKAAFHSIIGDIVGDQGAPISFKETLPPGVDVNIPGGIQILRTVNDFEYCQPRYQQDTCRRPFGNGEINITKASENGRVVITFNFTNANYAENVPFESENFFVNLALKTDNASEPKFDTDQNWDSSCRAELDPANPVSFVNWSFPLSKVPDTKTGMPPLCVVMRTAPYTGDVYGLGVGRYDFPYIDALVSGAGIVPGSQAVWELPSYDFSATSFSNFGNYQNYLNGQIDSLKQKATLRGNAVLALQSPVDKNLRPEGEISYIPISAGNQTIGSDISLGNGRRTVIIEGDLTIDASIVKNVDKESTAAIIVLGNVSINSATSAGMSIEAGIISPGKKNTNGVITGGTITIENTSNYLNILGFLIGNNVQLKGLGQAVTQSILYDPDLIKFPPPGLAGLSLPLYQEVAP